MFRRARWLQFFGVVAAGMLITGCTGQSSSLLPNGDFGAGSDLAATLGHGDAPAGHFAGWLQPGLNSAHTADNAAETTLSRQNVGSLTLGWSFPTGGLGLAGASILTDGSTAYAASGDGNLYAINIADGTQKWSFPTEYTGESGSWIAIAKNTIYAAPCYVGSNTSGAGLCAINVSTGKLRWNWYATCNCRPVPAVAVGPVVAKSTVVFAYDSGGAYGKDYFVALNAATGANLWQAVVGLGNPSGSTGPDLPAIYGGNLFAGTDAGLCSLRLSSGALNWCTGPNAVFGSAAVAKGVVYLTNVAYNQAVFYAFNAATGAQIWQYSPPSGYFGTADPPAIAGKTVFFAANQEGPIYALDAKTGGLLFTAGAGSQGAKSLSSPSVANGVVYVACYAGLCAYNASTGAQLLVTGAGGDFEQSPAIANGKVFVACAGRYTGLCAPGAYSSVAMYELPGSR